jgi:hypothetical protein
MIVYITSVHFSNMYKIKKSGDYILTKSDVMLHNIECKIIILKDSILYESIFLYGGKRESSIDQADEKHCGLYIQLRIYIAFTFDKKFRL